MPLTSGVSMKASMPMELAGDARDHGRLARCEVRVARVVVGVGIGGPWAMFVVGG